MLYNVVSIRSTKEHLKGGYTVNRFASFDQLRGLLEKYTAEDYGTFLPFNDLLDCAMVNVPHYNCAVYKQYAKILLQDAVKKGCDPAVIQSEIDKYYVSIVLQNDQSNYIVNFIKRVAEDESMMGKVSVLPIICGAGKSTAISYLIMKVIKNVAECGANQGVLIVTDNKRRMTEYVEPDSDRDPELRAYLDAHAKDYTLLRGEDLRSGLIKQAKTPVLIMTTQRYFALSPEEIQHFLHWGEGGTRPLILFDEAIPLTEVITVGRRHFNDVSSALNEGLYYGSDHEERRWCIDWWEQIRKKVFDDIKEMEDTYDHQDFCRLYRITDGNFDTDYERFTAFVAKHTQEIRLYDKKHSASLTRDLDTLSMIPLLHHMLTQGCLYHCSKKGNWYHSNFSILGDNRNKLLELGAKVIVMDGTADIHPNYWQDYVDIRDGSKYARRMDNLSLRFIGGIGTSKSQLSDADEHIKLIYDYVRKLHPRDRIAAFTYEAAESIAAKHFKATAHFGDIKGKNDFRHYTCIAQLGQNRAPEYFYLTHFLWNNQEHLDKLHDLSLEDTAQYISEMQKTEEYKKLLNGFLIADLEQNMFRCAIRLPDFVDPAHYYVFCNTQTYSSLISEAQNRYHLLGASVKSVDAAEDFTLSRIDDIPEDKRTIEQRIIAAIKAYPVGTEFTTRATPTEGKNCRSLLEDAKVSAKQFAKAKEKSQYLKALLASMYSTKGYYIKR